MGHSPALRDSASRGRTGGIRWCEDGRMLVSFDGVTPTVDATAFVAPNATLIGRVTLAPGSSVFYGAVLRGDTDSITIGEGSNVQDNVSMHTDAGIQLVVGTERQHRPQRGRARMRDRGRLPDRDGLGRAQPRGHRCRARSSRPVRSCSRTPLCRPARSSRGSPRRCGAPLTDEEIEGVRANAAALCRAGRAPPRPRLARNESDDDHRQHRDPDDGRTDPAIAARRSTGDGGDARGERAEQGQTRDLQQRPAKAPATTTRMAAITAARARSRSPRSASVGVWGSAAGRWAVFVSGNGVIIVAAPRRS